MSKQFLNVKAAYASITCAILIVAAKVFGWYVTDSTTLLASLADSLLDVTTSIINFSAILYALKPADNEHRFGHGKAEDLAVFVQGCFFIISCIFVVVVATQKIITPEPLQHETIGLWVMVFSCVLTVALVSYQSYVIKKTHSNVITADRLHYAMDLSTNFGVMISIYATKRFNLILLDPIIAIFIAIYIAYSASKLISRSFQNLMDHEFHESDKDKIHYIIGKHPKVKGYHDLKTRKGGQNSFIQFHIELDKNMTVKESHKIAEELEDAILKEFTDAEIIIHQDPEGVDEHKQFDK